MNEANTRFVVLVRLARKGPPWPSGSEYRAAKARAEELFTYKEREVRVLDPGHLYATQTYPSREMHGVQPQTSANCVRFRKRIGAGYEPNVPPIYAGTSTQELLRVIIDRTKYVDAQKPHKANAGVIKRARESLVDLEFRAAEIRGMDYYKEWGAILANWLNEGKQVETAEACQLCGHIFCLKHC